jgi:hypothetical protein
MNVFDAVVVLFSVIELVLNLTDATNGGTTGVSAIRVLRIFRVFRIFKLARGFKALSEMLTILGRSLPSVFSIFFITMVMCLVFAAIGQQVFGGGYADAIAAGRLNEYPRHNYDSFGWSLVSVLQLLDGENAFQPMYQHMAAFGAPAALFFKVVALVGATVMGITLSVFMKGFDEQEEENKQLEIDEGIRKD